MGDSSLNETAGDGLKAGHYLTNQLVSALFKLRENSGSEEHFGQSDSIERSVYVEFLKHQICGNLTLQILLRHIRTKNFVTCSELSKRQPVWESRAGNANTFEYTITSKLIEDKRRAELFGSFLVIRQNASDEMRMCRMQLAHQRRQLLFVPLSNCSEKSLLHTTSCRSNVVVGICAIRKEMGDVLIT